MIAIEVPRFLRGDAKTGIGESTYNKINYLGIAVITLSCGAAAYFRWHLSEQFIGIPHKPENGLLITIMSLYVWVAVLLIFTAVFLGDALRRLRAQIVGNDNMELAQQTMRLHVFVMFFHTTTFACCNTTLVTSLFFPSGTTPMLWNLTKILMFIAQSISQLIIMFLIEKLSKPMVLKKEEQKEILETDDYDLNDSFASSDFEVICHLRRSFSKGVAMDRDGNINREEVKSSKHNSQRSEDKNPLATSGKSVDLYNIRNSHYEARNTLEKDDTPVVEDFTEEDRLMVSQRLKNSKIKYNNSSINAPGHQ